MECQPKKITICVWNRPSTKTSWCAPLPSPFPEHPLTSSLLQQLRISANSDPIKVYISPIDDASYNKIRQEQSLHVSFPGFLEQLVAILDSCRKGDLHAALLLENNKNILQFHEKRLFRNLIHLYLPISEAPVEAILHHVNQTMNKLQEQHAYQVNQIDALRSELCIKEESSSGLKDEIRRLKAALAEQENMIFARNMDEVKNLQHSLKNLNELKDNDERQLKGIIFGLQEKAERLTKEHAQLNDKLSTTEKCSDSYKAECARLNQQLALLNEQLSHLQCEVDGQKTRDRKQELNLLDLKRHLKDSRDKGNALEKQRSDLIAELEAEKIVCQTKRKALQIATEEITKANDIILKQSKEIVQLKRKGEDRAAVALRQEEIIQANEEALQKLRKDHEAATKELQTKVQTTKQLTSHIEEMKEFTGKMEDQYKQSMRFGFVSRSTSFSNTYFPPQKLSNWRGNWPTAIECRTPIR